MLLMSKPSSKFSIWMTWTPPDDGGGAAESALDDERLRVSFSFNLLGKWAHTAAEAEPCGGRPLALWAAARGALPPALVVERSPMLAEKGCAPSYSLHVRYLLGGSGGGAHGAMHEERERLLPAPSLLTAAPAPRGAAPIPVKAARAAYGTGTGAIV